MKVRCTEHEIFTEYNKIRKVGKQSMNEREQIKQIIDRLPDSKIAYVANLILNIEKMTIEEVEPDEWDLKMIEHARENNDGSTISFDDLLKKEGLTYADL